MAIQVALLALAAGLAAFTIVQGIAPHDEGLMLQAGARIASGEWPYRDFWMNYPPGQPLVLAGLQKIFGTSLLGWRVVAVAIDAVVALLAYRLARRRAHGEHAARRLAGGGRRDGVSEAARARTPRAAAGLRGAAGGAPAAGLAGVLAGAGVPVPGRAGGGGDRRRCLAVPRGQRARAIGAAAAVAIVRWAVLHRRAGAMWHDTSASTASRTSSGSRSRSAFDGPLAAQQADRVLHPADPGGRRGGVVRADGDRPRAPYRQRARLDARRDRRGPRADGPDPEAWSLAPLALVGLAYLLGRTDVYHLVPLAAVLPVTLAWAATAARVAVAPGGAARGAGADRHLRRRAARGPGAAPAGAARRYPARPATASRPRPADARALAALRDELAQITAPGEPIFVTDPRMTASPPATRCSTSSPAIPTRRAMTSCSPAW